MKFFTFGFLSSLCLPSATGFQQLSRPLFRATVNKKNGAVTLRAQSDGYTAASKTSGPAGSGTLTQTLTPLEAWFVSSMDIWYSQSLRIKCPFFKRRMADILDAVDMVMRFVIVRHKSLDLIGPPPGCRSSTMSKVKHRGLSLEELEEIIRRDWRQDTNKGYYITGHLNTTIYRDDCLFDGPDPDMPVRGLRKYLNAASHLFDHATSSAELLSLERSSEATIVARWKLQGVLHLPWHPKLPVWTGSTTYHFDDECLIRLHKETWDLSVIEAFTQTLWPEAAQFLWKKEDGNADITS